MNIQLGMRGHDLVGKTDFETLIKTCKEHNINSIQLAFDKAISDIEFDRGNFSPGLATYIGDKLRENKISVPVLGCYINTVNPDARVLRESKKKFKEHLLYAKYMGAHLVGTESGTPHPENKPTPDTRTKLNYDRCVLTIKELVEEAEKLGVNVGIEGVSKETIHSPEVMKKLLADVNSPNLLVIYDIANLVDPNETNSESDVNDNITRSFAYYGDKIACVHIKDFIIKKDEEGKLVKVPVPIGEGLIDFEFLLKVLRKKKPYIHMLLEESNKDRCQKDFDYIKSAFDQLT